MAVNVEVERGSLVVRCSGAAALLCFRSEMRIPASDITGAKVCTRTEARQTLGWRLAGGYVPGRLATGWFAVPKRRGERQWWAVFGAKEVLVVDTNRLRPSRVVVECANPSEIIAQLGFTRDGVRLDMRS